MPKNKFLIYFICSLFAILLILSVLILRQLYIEQKLLEKKHNAWLALEEKINAQVDSFSQDAGIIIKDLSTGWEIAVNEDKLFPSASIVKVPIMASIFSVSIEKGFDLNRTLTLKNKYKVSGSGRLKDYSAGGEFYIEDLIERMITESDNTAANMLIDYLEFETLNSSFKKLGLSNTNIVRRMMDFESRSRGLENYTCAKDIAFLLERIYNNKLINKDFSRKCLEILKRQKMSDRIPARLPANTVVAHKTGLERGVCHDVGIVFTAKGDFVICVLTKHSYKAARHAKRFISIIARDVYDFYQLNSIR